MRTDPLVSALDLNWPACMPAAGHFYVRGADASMSREDRNPSELRSMKCL